MPARTQTLAALIAIAVARVEARLAARVGVGGAVHAATLPRAPRAVSRNPSSLDRNPK
jgi:hypothetical protein